MEYFTDAVVAVGLLIISALVFLALWCWAAARNVKVLDQELEMARLVGQMSILKCVGLIWYKEQLYAGPDLGGNDGELFLTMQIMWPEETIELTAKWAEDTDPDFQRELTNGKE